MYLAPGANKICAQLPQKLLNYEMKNGTKHGKRITFCYWYIRIVNNRRCQ